jgi:hypothetical protein
VGTAFGTKTTESKRLAAIVQLASETGTAGEVTTGVHEATATKNGTRIGAKEKRKRTETAAETEIVTAIGNAIETATAKETGTAEEMAAETAEAGRAVVVAVGAVETAAVAAGTADEVTGRRTLRTGARTRSAISTAKSR